MGIASHRSMIYFGDLHAVNDKRMKTGLGHHGYSPVCYYYFKDCFSVYCALGQFFFCLVDKKELFADWFSTLVHLSINSLY